MTLIIKLSLRNDHGVVGVEMVLGVKLIVGREERTIELVVALRRRLVGVPLGTLNQLLWNLKFLMEVIFILPEGLR